MTKIIGLTGGIGSGKTTIAKYFLAANVPVYVADDEAKIIMQNPNIIAEIHAVFGSEIFDNQVLNRAKLSQIVFGNSEKLKLLNAIVHPAVRNHFAEWVANQSESAYVVYESAILFESGSFAQCALIVTVTAPLETRIERVIIRDNSTREQVLKRISAQWDDNLRIPKSDFVIENVDPLEAKIEVEKILNFLNISYR